MSKIDTPALKTTRLLPLIVVEMWCGRSVPN